MILTIVMVAMTGDNDSDIEDGSGGCDNDCGDGE